MLLKPQRLKLNEDTPSPLGNSLTALETEQTNEEKAAEKAAEEADAEQKTYKEAAKLGEDKAAAAEQAMGKHAASSKADRAAPSKSTKAEAAVKKPDHGLALHVASSPGSAACMAQAPYSQKAHSPSRATVGASGDAARAPSLSSNCNVRGSTGLSQLNHPAQVGERAMSLLTVVALVGAAFKVDLRNNVFDDVASGVASGVACPPQWLPVVLAAGISPQPPAPDESRWSMLRRSQRSRIGAGCFLMEASAQTTQACGAKRGSIGTVTRSAASAVRNRGVVSRRFTRASIQAPAAARPSLRPPIRLPPRRRRRRRRHRCRRGISTIARPA
eukprot:scaffold39158_cov71-Phaeocystis_antarctica.AAC.3